MTSRTLLITGGSSGIGLATACLFAQRGWQVYALSRRGAVHADAATPDVATCDVHHMACDVTRPEQCRQAVAQVVAATGRLDVVVACAGWGIAGPIEYTDPDDAHRLMDVNVHGAMHIVQAALPQLRAQHAGRIILVGSVAGPFSIPFQAWYSASKAALSALAAALRNEVRPHGISVCCALPGDVRTGFTQARHTSAVGADVYPHAAQSVAVMEHDERHGMSPQYAARRLWHLANRRRVSLNHVIGPKYALLLLLGRFLPATLINRIIGWMY